MVGMVVMQHAMIALICPLTGQQLIIKQSIYILPVPEIFVPFNEVIWAVKMKTITANTVITMYLKYKKQLGKCMYNPGDRVTNNCCVHLCENIHVYLLKYTSSKVLR